MHTYRNQRRLILGPERLPAVPSDLTYQAEIPGIPDVRYCMSGDPEPVIRSGIKALAREKEHLSRTGRGDAYPELNVLAISGGGDKGAFAAGLLSGWTQAGTRPEFGIVTGISTGALIAPFAFAGPDYDSVPSDIYTSIGPNNIYRTRKLLTALVDDGLRDTLPLWNLIETAMNEELLGTIAREWEKGRWLLIGTTNLDARRATIWDIGAIAGSGRPEALDLCRRILLASASIPGLFPPVMIEVEVEGKRYHEMHVDGGTAAQAFLFPTRVGPVAKSRGLLADRPKRTAYIIRNSRLDPEWASVDRRTLSIMQQSIMSLIHTQGIGDLWRMHAITKRDNVDFNLAYIGSDFKCEYNHDFDTNFMRALFEYGQGLAKKGYPWEKHPPGFDG